MLSAEATSPPAAADHPQASYDPLRWLIPLALLHALLFLALAPPWQHYDEPPHFEYAWLMANTDQLPSFNTVDNDLRREVADSMYRFRFYGSGVRPDIGASDGPILGENQRVHPPLYYMLAALPLRLSAGLAIEQQLYLARGIGLCFYVLTIVTAWRIATVIVPEEPLMQLAVPLLVLLTPTFADLMTSVNNDVLVNFCAAALLLGCVSLIRDGPRLTPLALASLALGVGLVTKRTAVILLAPYALALIWTWRRQPLRLWAVAGGLLVGGLALANAGLELGRADDGITLLTLRPWLAQIDQSYLRLNLDEWVRSASSPGQAGDLYRQLLTVGFTTFWTRFGWGNVTIGVWADWAIAAICAACGAGLLAQGWRARGRLPVWQRRCIWLFLSLLLLGVLSMIARLHPLPPPGVKPYIPTGRYIFTVMLPLIWLLALGWQGLLPARRQPAGPLLLLGIWLVFDLLAWGATLVGFYYRAI